MKNREELIRLREQQSETSLNHATEKLLRLYENLGVLVYQKNNSGASRTPDGKRFIRFGRAGSPDYYVFLKNGITIHLELKTKRGRLNYGQLMYKSKIEKLGHTYLIVQDASYLKTVLGLG